MDVATEMIANGPYGEFTMRHLAERLGVAPMTVYGHIKDRDDLLDSVVDRLLEPVWQPGSTVQAPYPYLIDAARRFHDLLVSQPAALHIYLERAVTAPVAMRRMAAMMELLQSTGLNEESALAAYGAIHTYTIGFAALETSRSLDQAVTADRDTATLRAMVGPEQFEHGLELLLRGLDLRDE